MFLKDTIGKKKYNRIVSLVPSLTELLFSLGLAKEVVGITKFCIHPDEWFRTKIRVGGTKKLHLEEIRHLKPDLIIANKEENVKEQIENLAGDHDVWVTDVNNLEDAVKMIQDIGELTGKESKAYEIQRNILKRFVELQKNIKGKKRIRGAYFIWQDPYMVAGNDTFIHAMLPFAGIENVFTGETRYPVIDLKELKKRKCDLILLSSEPYPFGEKHQKEMQEMFPEIKAILVNGEMFSWYGSRLAEASEYFSSLWSELNSPASGESSAEEFASDQIIL